MSSEFESFKSGDQIAFKNIFERHNRKFFYIIKENFDIHPLDIEEIVSSCWYKVWQKRDILESEKHLNNYMRKVLYSKALKHLSKDKRAAKLYPLLDLDEIADEENADFEYDYQAKVKRTIEAIKQLPRTMQKVLECVNYGMGAYQTAAILNMKVSKVWTQKSQALHFVRCIINGLPPKRKRKSRAKQYNCC